MLCMGLIKLLQGVVPANNIDESLPEFERSEELPHAIIVTKKAKDKKFIKAIITQNYAGSGQIEMVYIKLHNCLTKGNSDLELRIMNAA